MDIDKLKPTPFNQASPANKLLFLGDILNGFYNELGPKSCGAYSTTYYLIKYEI